MVVRGETFYKGKSLLYLYFEVQIVWELMNV